MAVPNVVMIGNCGTGKSTVVERMTGATGLSSDASMSHTKKQNRVRARDGSVCIVDTPGQNALNGALEQNVEVALALNAEPVALMLFTTKAEARLEAVVENVRSYVERFIDFSDLICIAVTHMDEADSKQFQWTQEACRQAIAGEFEIHKVIFTANNTPHAALLSDVQAQLVSPPRNFDIDSENFLQYFRICKSKIQIMKAIKDRVEDYKQDITEFKNQVTSWPSGKKVDLMFKFNHWMTDRIYEEQEALSKKFGWDFVSVVNGNDVDQQSGYISHMSSQMRAALFEVRTILLSYQQDAGLGVLRKCPHCPLIWGKWEGCDGSTTCGQRPSQAKEWRNGVLHNFAFTKGSKSSGTKLQVAERPMEQARGAATGKGVGCGNSITWSSMQPVTAGTTKDQHDKDAPWSIADIQTVTAVGISTTDVKPLPKVAQDKLQEKYAAAFAPLYAQALRKTMGNQNSSQRQMLYAGP